ncbi:HTH domain-containing protein [Halorientalis brevis]|uniref:HTH domain-containing protein n=1 Tax=Halorientalis brevis TaxID=1126241 RepID=A0ABD6CF70_9EURY|nr:HTH domain-containing protein [Halorientalis brevis]
MNSRTRATLYLRDSVPAAARAEQQKAVGRLQSLQAAGVVDSVTIESWPSRVTNGTPDTIQALATYDSFDSWARDHGASMRPAFDRHECHSRFTGSRFTTTVFPVMCLAVFENDTLTAVYPHARQGRPMTVLEGIAILESTRRPELARH